MATNTGYYKAGGSTIRSVRTPDGVWQAAGELAAEQGTNRTELICQWLAEYVETGQASPGGRRRGKVKITAAERERVREALGGLDIASIVVDAINENR